MATLTNNGICRCCASEGTFKDVRSVYVWMGEEEIYADMLKECFDITLSAQEGLSGVCEVCVTQLRNARNFKRQVLDIEDRFRRHLFDDLLNRECTPAPHSLLVKMEVQAEGHSESEPDDVDDEDYTPEFKEVPVIKREASEEPKAKRRAKTTAKKKEGKRRRKRKRKNVGSATPERKLHRVNLTNILKYSNASPFRDKTSRGFCCLYCSKYFRNINELRAHVAQDDEKAKIHAMIDYKLSYNPIKVDITYLTCNLCDTEMQDLAEFKTHLVDVHGVVIHKHIKDIILPFRLEDGNSFECVICSVSHVSFKNLYLHMSTHYNNYFCDSCGTAYITIAAMRKHGKTHYQGNFQCDFCEKIFSSFTKKKYHEKGAHTGAGWLRNKCPHCPEIFVSYYDRSEHLSTVHNEKRVLYNCNACNKIYKKKFELNRHIKHHHLQQRNYLCDVCNAKFFSKRGLSEHLTNHNAGRRFTCDVCGLNFNTPRSLRDHIKGHNERTRFECELCKKVFMLKNSLKKHMTVHQNDLEIFKEFDDVRHLIDEREMTLKEIREESRRKAQEEAKEQIEFKHLPAEQIEYRELAKDKELNDLAKDQIELFEVEQSMLS